MFSEPCFKDAIWFCVRTEKFSVGHVHARSTDMYQDSNRVPHGGSFCISPISVRPSLYVIAVNVLSIFSKHSVCINGGPMLISRQGRFVSAIGGTVGIQSDMSLSFHRNDTQHVARIQMNSLCHVVDIRVKNYL